MALRSHHRERIKQSRVDGEWCKVPDDVFTQLHTSRESLAALEHAMEGRLVLPGMDEYEADRQIHDAAYQKFPLLIAYCRSFGDVKATLGNATLLDWWVTCRSGGHSTAGYSVNEGVVIDLSGLAYVSVDAANDLARVGAGTPFSMVNQTLGLYGLHVPGGGCLDVCVGGYMQGGGYGFTSREFGMNCDNAAAVTVMLYDGSIVVADSADNIDLWTAVRGGTGNNFGVLLEVTYQLRALHDLAGRVLFWPIEQAAEALATLQNDYTKTLTPQLGYMAALCNLPRPSEPGFDRGLLFMALYDGTDYNFDQALGPLASVGTPRQLYASRAPYGVLDQQLLAFVPDPPASTPLAPSSVCEVKQSGYVASPIDAAGWEKIVAYFQTSPNPFNLVVVEPYGGAINSYPLERSAFVHRDVYMDLFVDSFWKPGWMYNDQVEANSWLDGYMNLLAPYYNGEQYQNYPRPGLAGYRDAYWPGILDFLVGVKQKYDPKGFFRFEQMISPDPSSAARSNNPDRSP